MAVFNSSNYTTGTDRTRISEICLEFPPKVVSPGLAVLLVEKDKHETLVDYSLPRVQFQMVVIFALTRVIHSMLKKLGMPLFISHILAGIILSPIVFGDQHSLVNTSEDSIRVLGTMGGLGFTFFLFLSGVKMDIGLTYKSGKKVVCIGLLTVVVPMIFCLITMKILNPEDNVFTNKSFLLAVTYSGTSFPVIHCLLSELKILNSELGRLGLSAALIGDMVTLFLTMVSKWVKTGVLKGRNELMMDVGLALIFILIMMFVLRPLMKWMVRRTPESGKIKDICFYLVVLAFMMSPMLAKKLRVLVRYGPFMLGLAVPHGPPLGSALVEKFDPIITGLFLPVFASTCGLRFESSYFKFCNKFAYHQEIAAMVTLISKFGVSLLVALLFKMPIRDSLALAFIMISKGMVEIGSYSIMTDNRSISGDIFVRMTIMCILVASIVPIFVKKLYDPSRKYLCFQKRTIVNSKLNQELRMIGCIHAPSNANSIINLLCSFCPTKESPVALDVLHLVKLNGQATPLFITHQKLKKTLSNLSYSENVVVAFERFERNNSEAVSVNIFTAVSPPNLMYEDICNLSMDRLTSFIILPFHRRWYFDGSIESEDQNVRSLNFDILEKAPCSVGILVEGRRNRKGSKSRDALSSVSSSSYKIVVIFLGGKDDREALMLAKRISQHKSVKLTVINLKATNNLGGILDMDDRMLDDATLRDIIGSVHLTYIEKQVNDGPATSNYLRTIVKEYHLIIVGRRYKSEDPQTVGLHEWCEFQENGIIGDLLSSADFIGTYSLLIVQQQKQRVS